MFYKLIYATKITLVHKGENSENVDLLVLVLVSTVQNVYSGAVHLCTCYFQREFNSRGQQMLRYRLSQERLSEEKLSKKRSKFVGTGITDNSL